MGLYGSLWPKRHIAWSNSKSVQLLDLGRMAKDAMQRLSKHGRKSSRTYLNKQGKKSYAGTPFLKETQILGAILNMSCLVDHTASG